jgi:hypothetical protein
MDDDIDNSPGLIDSLLDFPAELDGLQFIGKRLIKGGDKRAIHLVKYPACLIAEDEARKVVVTVWMNWWSKTRYALDPTAPNPHWNSPTRTSEVWAQVGEAAQCESGQPFIFCIRCGIVLQHPVGLQSIGTKHIHNHRQTKLCQGTNDNVHAPPHTPFTPRVRTTPTSAPIYSTKAFERELVRVVVDSNWPFRSAEQPSFKRFIRFLRPGAVITTRYKFMDMLDRQYKESKEALLDDIDPTTKISIALDAWSAANHLSFLAVKVYYINSNWKLRERPCRGVTFVMYKLQSQYRTPCARYLYCYHSVLSQPDHWAATGYLYSDRRVTSAI